MHSLQSAVAISNVRFFKAFLPILAKMAYVIEVLNLLFYQSNGKLTVKETLY